MRILLIGNFAPPYEEENLSNISLLKRLEEEGHSCRVINISGHPSKDDRFVNAKSFPDFLIKLLRLCWRKDVIHFSTKGYLRVGLLKMMASIFVGKLVRAKTIITFHSELFSILGQMRSPFGGTQTLYTSFFLADRITFADRDTFEVASMYKKRPDFEFIPSFIYAPDGLRNSALTKLKDMTKVIVFSNVVYPSFVFDVLTDLLSRQTFSPETGIVISLSERPAGKLRRVLEETAGGMSEKLLFVDNDDVESMIAAYSRADIVIRPLSCDGETFFENFTLYIRQIYHSNGHIYHPAGLLLVKEGKTLEMCSRIITTLLLSEIDQQMEPHAIDSYDHFKKIYMN